MADATPPKQSFQKPGRAAFWIELGFLPIEVAYVPNAKAWRDTLKTLEIKAEPFPVTDGRCSWWWDRPGRPDVILITVGKRCKHYSQAQVAGIIAHECMHAFRRIKACIGEAKPSTEFEAYVMQALVQGVMHAHATLRSKPWKLPS